MTKKQVENVLSRIDRSKKPFGRWIREWEAETEDYMRSEGV